MQRTRRSLLRTGAAACGIATLGVSAGCVGSLLGGGGGGQRRWLYESGALNDAAHYQFGWVDVATGLANEEAFGGGFESQFVDGIEEAISPTGLDADDLDTFVGMEQAVVLEGSFGKGEVGEELEDDDFDDADDVGGYTLYTKDANGYAVAGGTVVQLRFFDGSDVEDALQTVVETGLGERERYHEANDDCKVLLDALGSGFLVSGRTHEETERSSPERGDFEHEVAAGTTLSVGGDTSQVRYVMVFDDAGDAEDVDLDDVEGFLEDDFSGTGFTGMSLSLEDVSASLSGRAVVGTGTTETDELFRG